MAEKKRIKHVSDLPTWFQLEKYKIAKNLDANGWYEQVCIRAHCLEYVSSEEGRDKAYKLSDGNGLFLLVRMKNETSSWKKLRVILA